MVERNERLCFLLVLRRSARVTHLHSPEVGQSRNNIGRGRDL
jgi:hypothetical protein